MHKVGESKIADSNINNLWRRYLQGRANKNGEFYRNKLWEHYHPLVKIIAKEVHERLPSYIELNDLVSYGEFGLIDSIKSYNPSRGVKFETYSSHRIEGAILDKIRELDWVPRSIRARSIQLEKAREYLLNILNHNPTDEELIKELSKKKYKDFNSKNNKKIETQKKAQYILCDAKNPLKIISLFETEEDDLERQDPIINYLKNKRASDPSYKLQKQSLKEVLTNGLTRAERLIIVLYYYEELTMKEIGRVLDLSEARVSQMHFSIIQRLKSRLTDNSQRHAGELEFMISTSN